MSEAGLLIGWNRAVVGKEQQAAELFGESIAYYGRLVAEKKLDGFEPVFLHAHGGDMNGFVLLRGSPAQIDAVRRSDEFESIMVRGLTMLEGMGAIDAYLGDSIARIMGIYTKAVAK